ncbi:unnamed protein product [Echinostoma caproni]|uniref:Uncharacterized protein n=1 Tax=Echinostoma caproni TaxID=27848 RepID=A0A3P8IUX8_9TREM|nr:unnamed protein product [Echinostoma caproni]
MISKEKPLGGPGFAPLNPATYIDALIQSHLNRAQLQNPRASEAEPDARTVNPKTEDLIKDPASPNGGSPSTDGDLRRSQPENNGTTRSSNIIHPHAAVESSASERNHVAPGKSTLEEQINKAIAEEIRAQIRSQTSDSGLPVGDNVALTQSESPHFNTATASSNTPSTDVLPSAGRPLKKRDRSNSYLFIQGNSDTAPASGDSATVSPSAPILADPTSGEAEEKKISALSRPNGTRLPHDISARLPLDAKILNSGWFIDTSAPVEDSGKTASMANKRTVTEVLSEDSKKSDPAPEVNSASNLAHLDRSGESHSPSVGEAESPGNLQIDLAAADISPSLTLNESHLPTSTSPKHLESTADILPTMSPNSVVRVPIPIAQSSSCRSESGQGPFSNTDCTTRLTPLGSHPKGLPPLLTLSSTEMVQLAQSKTVSPKSSPRSVVHQPT